MALLQARSRLVFAGRGYEPQFKKRKMLPQADDRGEQYPIANQPGRVMLCKIIRYYVIEGHHAHNRADDICTNGTGWTCRRRYQTVRLVEVPEYALEQLLAEHREEAAMNP